MRFKSSMESSYSQARKNNSQRIAAASARSASRIAFRSGWRLAAFGMNALDVGYAGEQAIPE